MEGEEYDIVIMGTGVTESILSGIFSMEGKKILTVDCNPYYGSDGASLNLTNLWKKFRQGEEVPKELGQNRDWNVDLIPKFVMAAGKLIRLIMKTEVYNYLSWKSVDGTFVYAPEVGGLLSSGKKKVLKVPSTPSEALNSKLMTMFEKNRCKNFFSFVQKFDEKKKDTYPKEDPFNTKFAKFVDSFGLQENTVDFIGHAVALYTTEDFLAMPTIDVLRKIKLYMDSAGRFSDSPFIYPHYGLAGIPEGFARKCAVNGGVFMLNVDIVDIEVDDKNNTNKVWGVYEGKKNFVTAKTIIASPEYLAKVGMKDRLQKVGTIVRCICILDHPIPKAEKSGAVQIIIPQKQSGRKNDIYIMMLGPTHSVCKKGFYLAIVSTILEGDNVDKDLKIAFDTIGDIKEKFVTKEDMYVPTNKDGQSGIWGTKTLDQTSHFESSSEDVLNIYKKITGKEYDTYVKVLDEE